MRHIKERIRCFILPFMVAVLTLAVGCRSSAPTYSTDRSGAAKSAHECTKPENPYDEGSGHHAGYEWAERTGSGTCGGNSQSFIEGCEEYESQESASQECEAKK